MAHTITHNCNKYTLLSNADIKIAEDEKIFTFHIPTVSELYTSIYDPSFFLGFMTLEEKDLENRLVEGELDRIRYISEILSFNNDPVYDPFIYFLQICCKNKLSLVDGWLALEDNILDNQVFDLFISCFQLGMGYIDEEKFKNRVQNISVKKTREELEWDQRQRELERKISNTKSKVSKTTTDIEDILSVIAHEFGRSFKELMNLNFYTIYSLYKSSMRIDAHRISLIGLGNGLSKSPYKHWTQIK